MGPYIRTEFHLSSVSVTILLICGLPLLRTISVVVLHKNSMWSAATCLSCCVRGMSGDVEAENGLSRKVVVDW